MCTGAAGCAFEVPAGLSILVLYDAPEIECGRRRLHACVENSLHPAKRVWAAAAHHEERVASDTWGSKRGEAR
jgi:hypothetical protein